MKKRSQGFRILFIGGIFFLLGTNFLAILFPAGNQNHKNYWYSSVGFELVPTTYADDDEDEDREDREERKSEREDHEDEDKDEDRDREEHKDDKDEDEDYYYIPPVSPAPTNPTTPTPTNPSTPTNPPSTTCRTVYDTVTSASGVKSQVPRQVCDTTTPTSPTVPEKTVTPTPVVPVPEKVTQKPVTPVTPPVTPAPVTPPSNNCRTLYETVYDTVTTASGTQKQEPRQVSRQVCDTTTPVAPVVPVPEKVVTSPTPVAPAKPTPHATQKNPTAPITGIYTNGTYRGDGYYSYAGGSITYTVSLTLQSSKIIEAHFIAFTPSGNGRYTRADGDAMLATLVRSQNASIDTVTGATGTSQAIQDAINIALRKARGENVTTTPPPVVSTVLPVALVPQSTVSPYVESTPIQSSDDVASGYISDALLSVIALPENQNSTETSTTSSDANTVLSDVTIQDIPVSPGVQDGGDNVPTSRLIERIATKDGRTYSIIKDLQSGKYILLDEKNGKGDPHTFQFKADAITYATTSEPAPKTFIERVFQFFASLFSGPSASPVIAESSIITKTQLLAQADVQTRTMERKILKQKIAEAIAQSEANAQSEIQNNQKPTIVPTASVQKNIVPVVQKPTAQVAPKKAVAPVQKTVPKKSAVNTVTQAS